MNAIINKFTLLILTIIAIFFSGGMYMYHEEYKMAVFIMPENENDIEWPNKKKWFDAHQWLSTPDYIKINDFSLLNLKYTPIKKLDDYRITLAIHRAVKKSINLEPHLSIFNLMSNSDFFDCLKDNLSYEYLMTSFDAESLLPIRDYFLFYFTLKGVNYEVELIREPYEGNFSYPYVGYVHKKGYWHLSGSDNYSYRNYIQRKHSNK